MEEFIYPENLESDFTYIVQNNINRIEAVFNITISQRGNKVMFDGSAPNKKRFKQYIEHILEFSEKYGSPDDGELKLSLSMAENGKISQIKDDLQKRIPILINGKQIYPKTYNQKAYISAIKKNDLTFGIGPAGTGKTFLAITMALNYLLNKDVERIVLTRPVVEAGEKLGFLPGDIKQKVNPYFRPLYDALYHLIGFEKTGELIDCGIIEIAPLAYMRGRTINKAFIILDEGQNTSNSQMKMFLTRFGLHSKVVVTADTTQIDLPDPNKSGIFKVIKILKGIPSIEVVHLTGRDVVRHSLVRKIIKAFAEK